jgi:hypothetical protein
MHGEGSACAVGWGGNWRGDGGGYGMVGGDGGAGWGVGHFFVVWWELEKRGLVDDVFEADVRYGARI